MSSRREQELQLRRELVKARQELRGVRIALDVVLSEVIALRKRAESVDIAAEIMRRAMSARGGDVDQGDHQGDADLGPAPAPVGRVTPRRSAGSCLRRRHGRIVRRPAPGGGR